MGMQDAAKIVTDAMIRGSIDLLHYFVNHNIDGSKNDVINTISENINNYLRNNKILLVSIYKTTKKEIIL